MVGSSPVYQTLVEDSPIVKPRATQLQGDGGAELSENTVTTGNSGGSNELIVFASPQPELVSSSRRGAHPTPIPMSAAALAPPPLIIASTPPNKLLCVAGAAKASLRTTAATSSGFALNTPAAFASNSMPTLVDGNNRESSVSLGEGAHVRRETQESSPSSADRSSSDHAIITPLPINIQVTTGTTSPQLDSQTYIGPCSLTNWRVEEEEEEEEEEKEEEEGEGRERLEECRQDNGGQEQWDREASQPLYLGRKIDLDNSEEGKGERKEEDTDEDRNENGNKGEHGEVDFGGKNRRRGR